MTLWGAKLHAMAAFPNADDVIARYVGRRIGIGVQIGDVARGIKFDPARDDIEDAADERDGLRGGVRAARDSDDGERTVEGGGWHAQHGRSGADARPGPSSCEVARRHTA